VATDTPYIRYLFSVILMFTFHKQSCDLTNTTQPLHQCSIYQSKVAGERIARMLRAGRSRPWREVLKEFIGSSEISVEPLKEYFRPLIVWLKEYRTTEDYPVGWDDTGVNSTDSSFGVRASEVVILCLVCLVVYVLSE
jgi:peptidyl-dipeptidase A